MTTSAFNARLNAALKIESAKNTRSDAQDILKDLLELGKRAEKAWVNPDIEGGYGVACAFSASELPEVLETLDIKRRNNPFTRASDWLDEYERNN